MLPHDPARNRSEMEARQGTRLKGHSIGVSKEKASDDDAADIPHREKELNKQKTGKEKLETF